MTFEDIGTGCFTRDQRLSLWYHFRGTGSKNRYQRLLATGALSRFSSSALSDVGEVSTSVHRLVVDIIVALRRVGEVRGESKRVKMWSVYQGFEFRFSFFVSYKLK